VKGLSFRVVADGDIYFTQDVPETAIEQRDSSLMESYAEVAAGHALRALSEGHDEVMLQFADPEGIIFPAGEWRTVAYHRKDNP